MPICATCGAFVPAGARFCPNCAAPIDAAETSSERKLASILFADLVGSTALGGSQDPERTRAQLESFYDSMAAEIVEAGGTVEKFVGDAVMAAFGAPAAYEDHAERALHAALSMQRQLEQLFGSALSLRIGVNTGEVVVGTPREESSFVTGDAVNVAARLEQAAEPGEIMVGERTVATVGGAFEFGEAALVQAKGKPDGVVARRLIRSLSLARPRGVGGLPPAFVGREHEFGVLRSTYRAVADEGRPHVVEIIGEAGTGKTRLVRELWAWLASDSPQTVRRAGRCVAYGRAATYAPIAEIVREHFGLHEDDSPETVRRRLGPRETLGLTLGLEAPADLHPLAARDRLQVACAEFFQELAGEHSAAVLIDDVHWAEQELLDVLHSVLLDVRGPLLIVTTARPEALSARSSGRDRDRHSTTLWLEPLTPELSEEMLDTMLPSKLPDELRALIVERAEGNPFFIEEIIASLIDDGALRREHEGWVLHEAPREVVVPGTVQALVAARIDRLNPPEKAALQAASVIGPLFWTGPIYDLVDGTDPDLRVLEERDFIRRQPGSSIIGEREYAIKHAVTREVAYNSLPKARRARLHARFAYWLERVGAGRDEHAAQLAHHYAEAAQPEDADLAWKGRDDELAGVRVQAVRWLRRAAVLAVGRYEMDEGLSLLHRALELEDEASAQVEIWSEIARANALFFDGEAFADAMREAIVRTDDAVSSGELYAELAFQSLVRAGMWRVLPDASLLDGWIDRALEAVPTESSARAKALIARCYADYDKPPELALEAFAIAERHGDPPLQSYGLDALALTAFVAHAYEEALARQRERVMLVEQIEDPDHRADVYANAIAPAVCCGEFEEARRYTAAHEATTESLSPHHRLHGISAVVELDELLGNWDRIRGCQNAVEVAVAENEATPCPRNARSLLVVALANGYLGNDAEAGRLEAMADDQKLEGYGTVIGAPRQQLALLRGDLEKVAALIGEPAVRRSTWFYCSSVASHLDALAALGARERLEAELPLLAAGSVYLEPFAQRALALVREDGDLLTRAAERFADLGLEWHAARTRALA